MKKILPKQMVIDGVLRVWKRSPMEVKVDGTAKEIQITFDEYHKKAVKFNEIKDLVGNKFGEIESVSFDGENFELCLKEA